MNVTAAQLIARRVERELKEREERQTDIIPFDQNGHRIHGWPSPHYVRRDIEHVRRLVEMWDEADDLSSILGLYHECNWCGERQKVTLGDDNVLRVDKPCPSENGITTVIELHVPSGRIIVDDDLRPIYDADMDDLDYNTALGQGKYVEAMAEVGCAYGPVGNSCPSLYRTGDGTYVIANSGYDQETDDEIPFDGEALASVCTDLWAYSIADYDDWVSKGGVVDSWTQTVVDVEPGTYRFTHHTGERTFDRDDYTKPIIYAHIEKVS